MPTPRRTGLLAGQLALLAGVLVLCEALVRGGVVSSLYLPAPTDVFGELTGLLAGDDGFYGNLAVTLQEFLAGYLLAVAAGILFGLFLALVPLAEEFFRPFLAALMAVPKVTVIPLLTLWFGLGLGHKVIIVFLFCFFPIVYNTIAGVKQTAAEHLKVARSFRASRVQVITKVVLPSAVPTIFAALRVEAAAALVGAIFGEMVASKAGLGNGLTEATSLYDTPKAFALIILITLVSVVGVTLIDQLERRVFLKWRLRQTRLR
ncbi:ABC transporter permease [Amycolatopsis sp. 195334CR]|uniref:ABC transporter permease n=1 Tax=Amycolatopsis sp. 195334CR TaxID=2814588 RepID=UPI001A9002D9|nr:ABC transporter permease [Amycolatopsis sp. 195334CR]MBN6038110.1 ABC transporter permease [Amycolatopsis sp. 195334CR]